MIQSTARQVSETAARQPSSTGRDYQLSTAEFEAIRELVGRHTGISLSDKKRELVYSRLAKRLRQLQLSSFADYVARIERGDREELLELINAITTNLTAFFRERHHFDYLASHVLPEIDRRDGKRSLRIWSAGCSSGEEPYSIAITVLEALPHWSSSNFEIFATDLDSNMVAHARHGIYAVDRVKDLPKPVLKAWFRRGKGDKSGLARVSPELQRILHFSVLNLMADWSLKGPLDAIFCRNVMIYFNKDTQRKLVDRFANMLAPNGHLFLGHSESLHNVSDRFTSKGKTVYQKIA